MQRSRKLQHFVSKKTSKVSSWFDAAVAASFSFVEKLRRCKFSRDLETMSMVLESLVKSSKRKRAILAVVVRSKAPPPKKVKKSSMVGESFEEPIIKMPQAGKEH